MRSLSASDVLRVWELGRDRHPVDRALLMLAMADAGLPEDALFALPVGERDAMLLEARTLTFGDRFEALAACPRCAALLGFSFLADTLQSDIPVSGGESANLLIEVEDDGLRLLLRRPDSHDLAAIADAASPEEARRELLRRCVAIASDDGRKQDGAALPNDLGERVSELLAESDPRADIELSVRCESCGHSWPVLFDIAGFFWAEIEALARSLLRDVAALARAFGWREADILAMSPARRRLYLELAQ